MTNITKYIGPQKDPRTSSIVDDIRNIDVNFINTCAVAGGFNLPTDPIALQYLKVNEIFDRLFKVAETNIVFASEMGSGKIADNNVKFGLGNNSKIRGLELISDISDASVINDTCLVTSSDIKAALPDKGAYRMVPFDNSGNLISSIHLSGDGPIAEKGEKTIKEFIKRQLPDNKKICIFCGDTNITTSKTFNKMQRGEIGKEIAEALYSLNGNDWIVFMSDLKVDKIRSGFVLYNQQLKKSTYKSEGDESAEADGTILAIKIPSTSDITALADIVKSIPNHYSCYTKFGPVKLSTDQSVEPIYTFHGDKNSILDENGQVNEKVFLDHSVLQLSSEICNRLMQGEQLPIDVRNVIVLNMGSIANSGKKNWNTDNIDNYSKIVQADKDLYNTLKSHYDKPGVTPLPIFEQIVGSSFAKEKVIEKGVDEMQITLPEEEYNTMMAEFVGVITALKKQIEKKGGGRKTIRRRKPRRKTNKRKFGKKVVKSRKRLYYA